VRILGAIMAVATLAVPLIHFPRDHFGHRAGIEWWYFTAGVDGTDGHRYSIFFTLFKRGDLILPVSQVVNLDTGARLGHTEQVLTARIGPTALNVRRPTAQLSYTAAANVWTLRASDTAYGLFMIAKPQKPYVLHGGGTGVIRQGSAVSRYYSSTRMDADGTIEYGRHAIGFHGTGWFDHQWGNFTNDQSALHWDWFSCRFDDRTELMLYRFRDGHASGTYVDRAGHGRLVRSFDAVAGRRALRALGRRWPLDWAIRVPSERLRLSLHAIVPDQLIRGVLLPSFWEGAVTATGTKRGVCFVEETS
jgi:predicted secreted hydrolase